jgi:hypothetical protein
MFADRSYDLLPDKVPPTLALLLIEPHQIIVLDIGIDVFRHCEHFELILAD